MDDACYEKTLREYTINTLIPNFTCGYCWRSHGYEVISSKITWGGIDGDDELPFGEPTIILKCRSCRFHSLAVFRVTGNEIPYSRKREFYLGEDPNVIRIGVVPDYPMMSVHYIKLMGIFPSSTQLVSQVPSQIRQNVREALNCLSIGATNAATIMSGRVLEAVCQELGVPTSKNRTLNRALETLKNTNIIDQETYEFFDEIRLWRNKGAHQSDETISWDHAELVVELVRKVVNKTYEKDKLEEWRKTLKGVRQRGGN